MSVDQTNVVDIVAEDSSGAILLVISDHLDWSNSRQHLFTLQEKVNTYIRFVDSGEIYEKYPKARDRVIQIDVRFHRTLPLQARSFLERMRSDVERFGFQFRYEVFAATPFPS